MEAPWDLKTINISSTSGINGFTKWGFQALLIGFDYQCQHHKEGIIWIKIWTLLQSNYELLYHYNEIHGQTLWNYQRASSIFKGNLFWLGIWHMVKMH